MFEEEENKKEKRQYEKENQRRGATNICKITHNQLWICKCFHFCCCCSHYVFLHFAHFHLYASYGGPAYDYVYLAQTKQAFIWRNLFRRRSTIPSKHRLARQPVLFLRVSHAFQSGYEWQERDKSYKPIRALFLVLFCTEFFFECSSRLGTMKFSEDKRRLLEMSRNILTEISILTTVNYP